MAQSGKITAKVVKELRELTGLPMMVCKQALIETGGDVEAAREALRKQGQKVMDAKAGRQTKEGRVGAYVSPKADWGLLLALRCETEPVARCEDFVKFHEAVMEAAVRTSSPPEAIEDLLKLQLADGRTVQQALEDLVARIRENIQFGGLSVVRGDAVFSYIHADSRHGSLVALSGVSAEDSDVQEVGKNLCMHVVFAKPRFLSREEVPEEEVQKEREILLAAAENDPKHRNKPPEIKQKIVEGQLRRFYQAICLLEQPFVRDEKVTVQKYVAKEGKGAKVTGFAYVGLLE